MEAEYPRTYTYAMAIATLLLGSKGENEKLANEKFEALRKTASLLESYASRSFDERLLDVIMEKKAKMILEATKVSDVREIATPKAPEFLGDGWSVSRFSVPEEEMILWSMTSLKGPLNGPANKRFMELFKDFYGHSPDETIEGDDG